jgi:transcriptional regulator with XRE-family HTH domain
MNNDDILDQETIKRIDARKHHAENLRRWMSQNNLSTEELSRKLGCHINSVNNWYNAVTPIGPEFTRKLANLSGKDMNYFRTEFDRLKTIRKRRSKTLATRDDSINLQILEFLKSSKDSMDKQTEINHSLDQRLKAIEDFMTSTKH